MIDWPPSEADKIQARAIIGWLGQYSASHIVQYVGLANADYESNLNQNAKGDYLDANGKILPWSPHPTGTPSAFGMWQRQKPRLDIIRDGLPRKGIPGLGIDIYEAVMAGTNTIAWDAEAFMWELENIPRYGYAAIKAATNVRDATILACKTFEIATTSASDRGQRAEEWLKALA